MLRFPIPNTHSEIVNKNGQPTQTFFSWIRSVHDRLGGNTGKFPGIETSANGKISFFGAEPVEKQPKIDAPAGGEVIDAESRESIKQIITILQKFGFME